MQPGADAGGQAGRARADPEPAAFHGQRGKLRQAYREGQEDQPGVLGLVLNAVVLWNTGYIDAAVAGLRSSGYPVAREDAARLSPFGDKHVNMCWAGIPPPRRHPAASARWATRRPQTAIRTRYDHR